MPEPQNLVPFSHGHTLRTPRLAPPARAAEVDLTEELNRIRRELHDAGKDEIPVLRELGEGDVPLTLEYSSYEDGLIEDAKANLAAGNVELARAQVDEVLELVPGHHEARHLLIHCLMRQGDALGALEELESLRLDSPEPELAEQLVELRGALRRRLTAELLAEPDERRLVTFLSYVPEEGACWLELAVHRALAGELRAALEAAETGARAADDREHRWSLTNLAWQVRMAMLREMMPQLMPLLHAREFDRALRALAGLGPDWNAFEPVQDLAAHIVRLGRGEVSPPPLSSERTDVLYLLLADDDLAQAYKRFEEDRWLEALTIVERTILLVPADPQTNLMLGFCLVLTEGDLDRAERAARTAAGAESPQPAQALLAMITMARLSRENKRIFDGIGDALTCPISRLNAAAEQMRALEDRAGRLIREVPREDRAPVEELRTALRENAVQLELAALSRLLQELTAGGRPRGRRRDFDEVIRTCSRLSRETANRDVRQTLGQIDQVARRFREHA
ncbi:tetratricopeptide repeat protein [Nonomuraea sp. NPDC050310]|uniref:tetratricopeptide repeat protein n=1 Tax=Nonomuraea sp. NPDC050310 TaxID=3154935 RepID=UPI0033C7CF98